ncbi:glycerol-3-phosphate dehydrogenase (NAD(P)+) [Desulfitispora alkaliphila]|uniref:NAD(P)H-dependent glycerol-3-phosphate dehydrogenase n=1 Tax=Desulfitispora alkaliphila TaxID=622674 RepID=UPI003D1CBD4A
MTDVSVLGAGSWGTALATLLCNKGKKVKIWARSEATSQEINTEHTNKKYLPGANLPLSLECDTDLERVVSGSEVIVLSLPSHTVKDYLEQIKPLLNESTVIVNTAKGFDVGTLQRLSQVAATVLPGSENNFAMLSGPSHAEEVVKQMPTAVVSASKSKKTAEFVQDLFICSSFRVYTNPDLVGVELGGALKNVIALGTGISDGLGFGDNTKAAFIARGIAEIGRLGVAMGGNPLTFAGLSGVGDLIVTCTSAHSRNRRAGICIGSGKTLNQTLEEVGMVVEGVNATKAAYKLAQQYQVEMPIVEELYSILFADQEASSAVRNLMERVKTNEMEDIGLAGDLWENN